MAHMQQQILDAIQALVIAGATVAGDDVYVDRLDPLPKGKRAAILIREGDKGDDVQPGSIRDVQQRSLEVVIVCMLKACDDVTASARAFGLAIEKIVSPKNQQLRDLCSDWNLENSKLVPTGEGDEALASRVLTYRFTYFVRKGSPDAVA